MKIRKGDNVQILSGKDRGKRGKVQHVYPTTDHVVVEGLNIKKKHSRPRKGGEKGQIVEFPGRLLASRVALVCPNCSKAIRVSYRVSADGKKERWCKKCKTPIAK